MVAPYISRPVLAFFRYIVRGYFRRHFHAVRVSNVPTPAVLGDGPVIIFGNHSSWWDPMALVLLAARHMPTRQHFAPMDASALQRYGILKHIGVFGVEMKTARGAAQFLRTGLTILKQGGILWVTPQGRFVDVRQRPLVFKPGLAALASRVEGGCTLIPLALEYTFWDERLPEALIHFGEPIRIFEKSSEQLEPLLLAALTDTMDTLERKALTRNPAQFDLLQRGRAGTGGFYQLGQRAFARLRGRAFQAEHTVVPPPMDGDARG